MVIESCDFPPAVQRLPKVTRTLITIDASSRDIDELVRERLKIPKALYTPDVPVLETLRPDLNVTQALCDVYAVVEDEVRDAACMLLGSPQVINLEPQTLSQVVACIPQVAQADGNTLWSGICHRWIALHQPFRPTACRQFRVSRPCPSSRVTRSTGRYTGGSASVSRRLVTH
jgi:hypothetical protein